MIGEATAANESLAYPMMIAGLDKAGRTAEAAETRAAWPNLLHYRH